MNLLIIPLLFFTLLLFPVSVLAEQISVASQNSIPIEISQVVKVSATSAAPAAKLTIDWQIDSNTLRLYVLPLDEPVQVTIVPLDKKVIGYNQQYTWSGDTLTGTGHTYAFWLKQPTTIISAKNKPRVFEPPALIPFNKQKFNLVCGLAKISGTTPINSVGCEENYSEYTNGTRRQVSRVYELNNPAELPLTINIGYNDKTAASKQIYFFDVSELAWYPLPTYNDVRQRRATTFSSLSPVILAVFADDLATQGIASWYDQSKYRAFHYQGGNFAASRTLSKGTKVKVTRQKTGKSVIVTINDWGPEERTWRLIDLDKQAFTQLASSGAGETPVTIELIHD